MDKERPSQEEINRAWAKQKEQRLQERQKDWTEPMRQTENSLREQIGDPEARVNLVEIFTMLTDKNRRGELKNLPNITITFGGGENLGWTIKDEKGNKSITQVGDKGSIKF